MQAHTIRARDKGAVAQFLGWFSIALGTAQVSAPRAMCRVVGADDEGRAPLVMRLMGVRELAQGIGILVRPRPTGLVWSRVAGDAADLGLLGLVAARGEHRARTAFAIANVLPVAYADVSEAIRLARLDGEPTNAKRIRKAVTIRGTRAEVEEAWARADELRRQVEERDATVTFADAPGGRGTELAVEFEQDPPLGDLGLAAAKLSGQDLATQLSDDLRRLKQQLETGQVVRSDGAPEGHLLSEHLTQRPAQPQEEGVR